MLEVELLFACLRVFCQDPNNSSQWRVDRVEWRVDEDQFIKLIYWHKILPVIYFTLKQQQFLGISQSLQKKIEQQFQLQLQHNLLLTSELLKLLQKLNKAGIPVLPLKGVVLAATTYNNITLRQSVDLDLWLDRRDFEGVQTILHQQGYRPSPPLNSAQEQLHFNSNYQRVWLHSQHQISLDIHWKLAPSYFTAQLPFIEVWQRAKSGAIAGQTVSIISPEDLLLVLCLNGAKDGWGELQRITDLARCLITYPNLLWSEMWLRAEAARLPLMVLLGLALVSELLKISLPPLMVEKIKKNSEIVSLTQTIAQRLRQPYPSQLSLLQQALFPLNLQVSFGDRLRYLWGLIIPLNERDLEWITLPQPLFPLYYPLRLVRLVVKHWPTNQKNR